MSNKNEQRKVTITSDGKQVGTSLKEIEAAARGAAAELRKMDTADPRRADRIRDFQRLTAEAKELKTEIYGVGKSMNTLKDTFKGMLGAGGIMAGIMMLKQFGATGIEEFKKTALANAQLRQTIVSTNGVAGKTYAELKLAADRLKEITLIDDDQINQAQTLLLTFTNIKGGIYDQAIPAILDLATKMGGDGEADLKGASIQVGKALNDPIKGITALTRVGVSFTEQQKQQIKYFVENNQLAKAQAIILKELTVEFGGSAKAAADSAAGGFARLKLFFNDWLENLGQVASKLIDLVIPAQKEQAETLDDVREAMNSEIDVLKNSNLSQEARKVLIGNINDKYGEYLPNLITEKTTLAEINDIQKEANRLLMGKEMARQLAEEMAQINKDNVSSMRASAALELQIAKDQAALMTAQDNLQTTALQNKITLNTNLLNINKAIQSGIQGRIKETKDQFTKMAGEIGTTYDILLGQISGSGTTTETDPTIPGKTNNKSTMGTWFYDMLKERQEQDKEYKKAQLQADEDWMKEDYIILTFGHDAYIEYLKSGETDYFKWRKKMDKEAADLRIKTEKEAEEAILAKRKQGIQTASTLNSGFTNLITNLKDRELKNAGDNEAKKKQIMKDYADVDFAISASNIVVNTAESIMQGYAQLGPTGGTIAAILLAIVGATELAVAEDERQRIKSLYIGGYTGPGMGITDSSGHQVAGIVHANEYVTPAWVLNTPMGMNYTQALEAIRLGKSGSYSNNTSNQPGSAGATEELFNAILYRLNNPVPSVAYYGQDETVKLKDLINKLTLIEAAAKA
jgi:hypothetical protein